MLCRTLISGLLLSGALVPSAAAWGQPAAADGIPLRIAAGDPQGAYSALATEIARRLSAAGIPATVLSTAGSYDNAELLSQGSADLALMQSDVAYSQYFDGQPYRTLAGLYIEPIHVFVRRELGLGEVSDLLRVRRRLRLAVGEPGSGTSFHAQIVLAEVGLSDDRIERFELAPSEALKQLVQRRIDAAFLTSAVPAPVLDAAAVRGLPLDEALVLLDFDRPTASRLVRRFPFLHPARIPLHSYPFLEHAVSTLGSRSVLVGRPDLPPGLVNTLLDAVHATALEAPAGLPLLDQLGSTDPEDVSVPFLPAAAAYRASHAGWTSTHLPLVRRYALLVFCVLASLALAATFSRVAFFFERFRLLSLALALLLVWLLGAEVMFLAEGQNNVNFGSFGRSAEAILYYLFSGLESRYPVTTQGTLVALVVLSLGVTVVAAFTATVASRFVEMTLNVRTLRAKPFHRLKLRRHLVITGWSQRTQRILRQLRSPELKRPPTVVVITSDLARTRVESRSAYPDTWVVEGDPSQVATLRRANIDTARAALVLSDGWATTAHDGKPDAAGGGDLLSVATTVAIETLQRRVHTIVDLEARRFEDHLILSHADEVVVNERLSEGLISQCVVNPGILSVYEELLTFGRDSQEIYLAPVPAWLQDLTFREVQLLLVDHELLPLGFSPAGIGPPVLNPHPEQRLPTASPARCEPTPQLVFIADRRSTLPRNRPRKCGSARTCPHAGTADSGPAAPPDDRAKSKLQRFRAGICCTDGRWRRIADELCGNPQWRDRLVDLTVIGDSLDPAAPPADPRLRLVDGDPSDCGTLLRTSLPNLDRLVVLATLPDGNLRQDDVRAVDHRTLLVCQAARAAAPDLHLVVEVLDPRHRDIFQHLAPVEVVSVADLSEKLLAQAVINPGITHTYEELLGTNPQSAAQDSEIYLEPVPGAWTGTSFGAAYEDTVRGGSRQILLGFRTGAGKQRCTVLNPRRRRQGTRRTSEDWNHVLRGDDQIVVLSNLPPQWS